MMYWGHPDDVPFDAIRGMIAEVENGSDRAAAIVAASCVEDQLAFALKSKLRCEETVIREMFQVRGLLGSFSAKISMGYLLGLFDKETKKELDTIKEIRNTFAHRAHVHHFEAQRVRDLASRLSLSQRFELYVPPHSPITQEIKKGDTIMLGFGMRNATETEEGTPYLPRVAPDAVLSSRLKFIRACKHHLLMLFINAALASGIGWKAGPDELARLLSSPNKS